MQLLSCKDVCSSTLACKGLWHWGSALTSIDITMDPTKHKLASLLRFQAKRAPMGPKVRSAVILSHYYPGCTNLVGPVVLRGLMCISGEHKFQRGIGVFEQGYGGTFENERPAMLCDPHNALPWRSGLVAAQ